MQQFQQAETHKMMPIVDFCSLCDCRIKQFNSHNKINAKSLQKRKENLTKIFDLTNVCQKPEAKNEGKKNKTKNHDPIVISDIGMNVVKR
jgi:hypothetical protein